MLVTVALPFSAAEVRLQRNVASCARRCCLDVDRVFVVGLAQTFIQFLLQTMQLEGQSHLSTAGAHCFRSWMECS